MELVNGIEFMTIKHYRILDDLYLIIFNNTCL
jgi:hypothetical protein